MTLKLCHRYYFLTYWYVRISCPFRLLVNTLYPLHRYSVAIVLLQSCSALNLLRVSLVCFPHLLLQRVPFLLVQSTSFHSVVSIISCFTTGANLCILFLLLLLLPISGIHTAVALSSFWRVQIPCTKWQFLAFSRTLSGRVCAFSVQSLLLTSGVSVNVLPLGYAFI